MPTQPATKKRAPAKRKAPATPVQAEESAPKTPVVKPVKKPQHDYLYAVGRRKRAVARTRLTPGGSGAIVVNGKDFSVYFPTPELQNFVTDPLTATGRRDTVNLSIKVHGGGIHGQAQAARHGIARALLEIDEELRKTLKPLGFLRRDPREKERKKPGLRRARRGPQWAKR